MSLNNPQHNTIMRQYDLLQQQAAADLSARQEAVYKAIPAYEQLDNTIASVAAKHARAVISGQPASSKSIHEELQLLEKQKQDLLISHGYPADYLCHTYRCPDCKDTGYINGEKCHCFKQAIVDLVYAQSNIKEILKEENFNHFCLDYYSEEKDLRMGIAPRTHMKKVLENCYSFIDNFDHEFSNILFYGATGVGKTFLSNCIAKELLDRAHTVIYLSAIQLIKVFEDHAFNRFDNEAGTSDSMYQYILDCDLLIIDDLGTETVNSFTTSQLFDCLNGRLLRRKSTILSTNQKPEQLMDVYSERIFSRLISNYQVTLILGEDIRLKKAIS